jgi:flagellar biosynthesis/type III secretory pathway M-ring protein FliF/YscJ
MGPVFYVVIFALLAVLLVFAGVSLMVRRRKQFEAETRHSAATSDGSRRQRKQKRSQSRHARRKRH